MEGGGCRDNGCGNRSSPYDGQPEKGRMHRLTDSNSSCKNKGSKGENQRIYYSKGNYEAFARPEKPEGIEEKSAWLIGGGLASLAAACFLIRDAGMSGDKIHILEASDRTGGACDGILDSSRGYIMRGGREMENHFECLWDLFRSIPSLDTPGASVLDEFYWLNKADPNYSLCRVTENRESLPVHRGILVSAKRRDVRL